MLHVVESFDGQATEAWLLRALGALESVAPQHRWEFYATRAAPGRDDDAVRSLGAEVHHARAETAHPAAVLGDLRAVIQRGSFDVLHLHQDIMSALYLASSLGLPLRRRVVHVHNTELGLPTPSLWKTALLREPMRSACLTYADNIVGVSGAALDTFLKGRPRQPTRDSVLHCSIALPDRLTRTGREAVRASVRAELGLDGACRVVLFVGRMIPYKNPRFVLKVLSALADPSVVAVFAGRGEEEAVVAETAGAQGMRDRVRVLGWRDDIGRLMNASDALLWPAVEHPMEGLGLGVVEAQAAGLPAVVSHSIPDDAAVIPELLLRLPLAAGPEAWAEALLAALLAPRMSPEEARQAVAQSPFERRRSTAALASLHESGL